MFFGGRLELNISGFGQAHVRHSPGAGRAGLKPPRYPTTPAEAG